MSVFQVFEKFNDNHFAEHWSKQPLDSKKELIP